MIRCNQCMKVFASEDDLEMLVEEWDGNVLLRVTPLPDVDLFAPDSFLYTVFRGCPVCMTDAALMDLDDKPEPPKKKLKPSHFASHRVKAEAGATP